MTNLTLLSTAKLSIKPGLPWMSSKFEHVRVFYSFSTMHRSIRFTASDLHGPVSLLQYCKGINIGGFGNLNIPLKWQSRLKKCGHSRPADAHSATWPSSHALASFSTVQAPCTLQCITRYLIH
jgi:hypothetical protein